MTVPRSGWLAVGVAAAALVTSQAVSIHPAVLLAAAGLLVGIGAGLPGRSGRVTLLVGLGVGALALRLVVGPADAPLTAAPEGRGPWRMLVETVGSPREGRQVATLRLEDPSQAAFRLASTLPRYPAIEPGDVVLVEGRTRPRPDSPYGTYLERLGAWGTLHVDALSVVEAPGGPARTLERLRRAAGDALTVTLPEPEAGLAAGILIGLRDRVDREVAAAFTTAGVSHVVAISGWNIAIVAAAIGALAGRLGRRRRAIVTVLAIAAYIAFAGASPSVLRAGAMAGVVLLARESGRSGYASAALGWAAAILLLIDPRLITDAGFQLSTVATAGLIAWATPLTERLQRVTDGRVPRWLAESLGVSLAAQAATLPIVLASFGRLAIIAPAVNLLIVPLVAPAMAAGLISLLGGVLVASGAPTIVGAVVAAPGWVALRTIIAIVEASAGLPFASVTLAPPAGAMVGGSVAVAIVAAPVGRRFTATSRRATRHPDPPGPPGPPTAVVAPRARGPDRRSRAAAGALVVSLAVTGAVVVVRPAGVASITVLDVGQGDAILIEGASGGRLLVDGGPDPDRLLVALDRRLPPWDRRIDAVILTHPHEDHVAGLALLLDRYRVRRVFEPGMRGPGPGYAAWLERLAQPGAPARLGLATGDRLTVDAIRLTVLWPDPGRVPREPPDDGAGINNVSIVLLGEIGARRFLLTGDIEDGVDPELLARGMPPIDVLKVAHHGSRTATTAAFVDAVRPKVAVASAGADNTYGHPARSTLTRLTDAGARVYRTDVDGSVTIGFEASAITVSRRPRSSADAPAGRTLTGLSGEPGGRARPPRATARAFVCAIPALVDVAPLGDAGLAGPPPRNRLGAVAAASPMPHAAGRGRGRPLGYHRSDDHPVTGGSGCPAALAGSPVAGDRARVRGRRGRVHPRRGTAPMIAPLLYVWGDDDLGSERLVGRFATALEAELGSPLERWDVRADLATAGPLSTQLAERLATGVLFGGGTLAVVANPGALVRRNETRDRIVGAFGQMAAGNAVAFVEASASNAKGPGPRRLADAVTAAGGRIVAAMAPRPTALGAWIESEARERGLPLAPGAAREIADRLGARVTDGDVDRRYLSRVASTELDKLALRHTSPATPVTVDDVRALVAESTPGSVWALTDAVGERRADGAAAALDRLLDATPEPVLLAVLHRRTVELLELGDRLATGMALPAAARAMGISSEYRARMLAAQAQRWDTTELIAALGGLVELDAMVKGVPGSAGDAAQRRLAFQLWVRDHVEREGPADARTTRRGR